MLIQCARTGFSFRNARLQNEPALNRMTAPKFAGIADDFQANKTQMGRQYYQNILTNHQDLFSRPILKVGERSLNGLDFMKLIEELGQKPGASMFSDGELKGTKVVWVPEMIQLFFPAELSATAQEAFRAAIENLKVTKCVFSAIQPTTSDHHPGEEHVYLTPLGAKTLAEAKALEGESKLHRLLKLATPKMQKTATPEKKEQKPLPPKLDQLRYLIGKQVDDLTGWDLLKKMSGTHKKRGWLARYFSPGLKESQWAGRLNLENVRAFRTVLTRFQDLGILSVKGEGKSASYIVTERALEMAGCSDVSQAVEMTRDDYKAYFKSEIEQVETDKKKKQQQIQGFDDQYKTDAQALEKLKQTLDTKKKAVLTAHEEAKNETDKTRSAQMLEKVSESMLELDSLTNDVNARQEQLQQRKSHAEAARVFFFKWRQQTHQRVQRLQQLLFQLETTEVNKGINDFLVEMQALENQQQSGSGGLNSLLSPMVESVQGDYHASRESVRPEDVDIRLAEEKAYQSMQLDAAIAQLKAEQSGNSAPSSSSASYLLSNLTPPKAEQPAVKTQHAQ